MPIPVRSVSPERLSHAVAEDGVKKSSNPMVALLAGCIAGSIEACAVWPMENIKTQASYRHLPARATRTDLHIVASLWKPCAAATLQARDHSAIYRHRVRAHLHRAHDGVPEPVQWARRHPRGDDTQGRHSLRRQRVLQAPAGGRAGEALHGTPVPCGRGAFEDDVKGKLA